MVKPGDIFEIARTLTGIEFTPCDAGAAVKSINFTSQTDNSQAGSHQLVNDQLNEVQNECTLQIGDILLEINGSTTKTFLEEGRCQKNFNEYVHAQLKMHENDSDLQILLFLRPSGLNIKQRQLQLCTSSDSQPSPTYLRVKQALIREFGRTQFDTVRNVTVAALADRQGVNPTLSGQVHSITGLGHETDSEKLKLLARMEDLLSIGALNGEMPTYLRIKALLIAEFGETAFDTCKTQIHGCLEVRRGSSSQSKITGQEIGLLEIGPRPNYSMYDNRIVQTSYHAHKLWPSAVSAKDEIDWSCDVCGEKVKASRGFKWTCDQMCEWSACGYCVTRELGLQKSVTLKARMSEPLGLLLDGLKVYGLQDDCIAKESNCIIPGDIITAVGDKQVYTYSDFATELRAVLKRSTQVTLSLAEPYPSRPSDRIMKIPKSEMATVKGGCNGPTRLKQADIDQIAAGVCSGQSLEVRRLREQLARSSRLLTHGEEQLKIREAELTAIRTEVEAVHRNVAALSEREADLLREKSSAEIRIKELEHNLHECKTEALASVRALANERAARASETAGLRQKLKLVQVAGAVASDRAEVLAKALFDLEQKTANKKLINISTTTNEASKNERKPLVDV